MSFLHAIIFGIVEGLTEFLPISSTAHLELTQSMLGIATSDFIKSFQIAIQSGAILSVVVLYFRKIFSSHRYLLNIFIAFVPTGVIGFLLYKVIKQFLLGNIALAAVALLLGGVVILIFERHQKKNIVVANLPLDKKVEDLSVKELLYLGAIQALAVVPGVSRSGAVIIGGRMLGLPAGLIAEFSFVLAIPTMLAATFYDLFKSGFAFSSADWNALLVGFIISFAVALLSVKWLIGYVKRHTFEIFGWYRIVLGGLVLLLLIF
ncbi:MAG: undecaprenyl-diphosphate phosphatase [bacterium]|nr:undecaprenyl-diphosphate phosphatase [bacterium]